MEEKKKKCKHCKEEIDAKAKICPHCRKKQSNPILTVIIVLVIIGALGSCMGKGSDTKSTSASVPPAETVEPVNTPSDAKTEEVEAETTEMQGEQSVEATSQETQSPETMGQKNARSSAEQYLNYTAFSHSGLIDQLVYEGYSTEDATYAVEKCGADWNEQAAKTAKQYLNYSSFSRSGLIEQLEYEGYTAEQAEYGANAVGY